MKTTSFVKCFIGIMLLLALFAPCLAHAQNNYQFVRTIPNPKRFSPPIGVAADKRGDSIDIADFGLLVNNYNVNGTP